MSTRHAGTTLSTPPVTPPARGPHRPLARARSAIFRVALLALLGINIARLRDAWPPAELPAIVRMIGGNRPAEAENALHDRLRRAPHEGESRMLLAQTLARRGDMAGCAAQLRLVPPWWPSKPEALFLEGQSALAAKLAVQAEAAWRACLADDPLHPAPPRYLSGAAGELIGLLSLEGRHDEAASALWSIFEGASEADRPSILRAIVEARLREGTSATDPGSILRLREFAAADRGDVAARLALARVERGAGRPDQALRWVDEALAARPDDLAARRDRLAILDSRGDRAGFQAGVARLPAAADGDGDLWAYRGLARDLGGDRPGAAESYRRAIALRPSDESIRERLATVADLLGDRDQARSERGRARALRDARTAIADAYRAYRDASRERRPEADVGPILARLGDLAETLGRDREAASWKRLGGRSRR